MKVGDWLRDKEEGWPVKITRIGSIVEFSGKEAEGSIRADSLDKFFDVLSDPQSCEDIEFLLRARIDAGEIDVGLFNYVNKVGGTEYVAVDRVLVGGEDILSFQWFDEITPLFAPLFDADSSKGSSPKMR